MKLRMLHLLKGVSFLSLCLPSRSIHLHFFPKPLPIFSVLAVATAGTCVDPQNKVGHLAHRHRRLMLVPMSSARGIIRLQNMLLCIVIVWVVLCVVFFPETYLWFILCIAFSRKVENCVLCYFFYVKCFHRVVAVKRNFAVY